MILISLYQSALQIILSCNPKFSPRRIYIRSHSASLALSSGDGWHESTASRLAFHFTLLAANRLRERFLLEFFAVRIDLIVQGILNFYNRIVERFSGIVLHYKRKYLQFKEGHDICERITDFFH